ncbi:UNVERIFIED_CONTAM: hypothetical protein H355_012530 [Colinus virginianus]|nr:hypothetical protein H355_012530 [Colinus virginianus]
MLPIWHFCGYNHGELREGSQPSHVFPVFGVAAGQAASLSVITVKAVASMIMLSAKGKMQLTYPVFYIMLILMATSCVFQVKFLNQAMHLYEARTVVPINFVFCSTSAIISGVIFYQEFQSAAFLSVFMFLLGCLLSFLSVFAIAVNKKEEHLQVPYIDCGCIPGK